MTQTRRWLRPTRRLATGVLLCLPVAGWLGVRVVTRDPEPRVSAPGQYGGFTEARFRGWGRRSTYVRARDGTRLAVDMYFPKRWWLPTRERMPTVLYLARYHRATYQGRRIVTPPERAPSMFELLRHGYVLCVADIRGSGASFGTNDGPFGEVEGRDAYDVIEWIAAQPWSNGKVGMVGASYGGTIQYLAAAERPPHLRAIFPEMAMFDLYEFSFPGGVMREDFGRRWSSDVHALDTRTPPVPVDGDGSRALADSAVAEHGPNRRAIDAFGGLRYRDSVDPLRRAPLQVTRSPSYHLPRINASAVPVYHLGGWFDIWARDAVLWYVNLRVPRKLTIGPWPHMGRAGFDVVTEQLRWFDYWLKGVDNGILREPPIRYATMGAAGQTHWRWAWSWPPPGHGVQPYFLTSGPSGSVRSVNDGRLTTSAPVTPGTRGGRERRLADAYAVDTSTTSGRTTRWTNGYGGRFGYPDMSANDARALTYTTDVLARPLEITGHPVARLWVDATGRDVNLVAYLEYVDARGTSHYITEGVLRASHRRLASPPFDNLGLPYHPGTRASVEPLPHTPVELVFDLHPTSIIVSAGHRLRLAITSADRDNLALDLPSRHDTLRIYRTAGMPSRIEIPVAAPTP
jgi:uncharacterized protein